MPTPQVVPFVADLANPTRSGAPDMPTSPPKSPHAVHAPQFMKHPHASRPGRQIRRCGRAVARPARRALLLGGAVAAMLGMPAVAQAAATPAQAAAATAHVVAATAHAAANPARATVNASPAGPALPAGAVTTTAVQVPAQPAAPSGGICKVPGIGDIGGLFGFCAQGSSGIVGDLNNICQPSEIGRASCRERVWIWGGGVS